MLELKITTVDSLPLPPTAGRTPEIFGRVSRGVFNVFFSLSGSARANEVEVRVDFYLDSMHPRMLTFLKESDMYIKSLDNRQMLRFWAFRWGFLRLSIHTEDTFFYSMLAFFFYVSSLQHIFCVGMCAEEKVTKISRRFRWGVFIIYICHTRGHTGGWFLSDWFFFCLFFCVGRQRWKADRAEIGKVDRIIISHISRFSLSSTKLAIRKPCGARKETWQFSFPDDPERMWHTGKPSK